MGWTLRKMYQAGTKETLLAAFTRLILIGCLFAAGGWSDDHWLALLPFWLSLAQFGSVWLECVVLPNGRRFFHISRRMRQNALQRAWGSAGLAKLAMGAASFGYLTPVWGP